MISGAKKTVRGMPRTVSAYWLKLWRGNPPGIFLALLSLVVGCAMFVPVLYVFVRGLQGGAASWMRLLDTRIPILLQRSLALTLVVTALGVVIGVSSAWLVVRTDLPGKRTWQWLLALPMVIPPYIGAITYIIIFGPRGWVRVPMFSIYSFGGVALVLTAFTYPYVYLVCSASLKRMSRSYEEAAQAAGLSHMAVFFRTVLPMLRPAIGAGALLIALYVLSDFGAISILRYNTFTTAIYYQMGSFDQKAASILSVILMFISLALIWLEVKTRQKQKFYVAKGGLARGAEIPLGIYKWPSFIFVISLFALSVLLPLGVLVYWSYTGVTQGAIDQRFLGFALNSLTTAGIATVISMTFALPIVYMKIRHPSTLSYSLDRMAYAGYALPGVIVALGLVFVFNNYLPFLYGSMAMLVIAYVVRFLPQNMQAAEAALNLVPPSIEEAGRSLGLPPWKTLFKITLPVVAPGILAGGAFVFVSALKELPATLLLRPPGLDTLAVRVWVEAGEGIYHAAAPAALLIILVSVLPLKWMLSKY